MKKISKTKLKRITKYVSKNKYWITISLFLLWIIFFDENNFFRLSEYNNDIVDLKAQKEFLETKIHQDSIRIKELNTDDKSLEKFAREQYFFHKPNEDVFIIKKEK